MWLVSSLTRWIVILCHFDHFNVSFRLLFCLSTNLVHACRSGWFSWKAFKLLPYSKNSNISYTCIRYIFMMIYMPVIEYIKYIIMLLKCFFLKLYRRWWEEDQNIPLTYLNKALKKKKKHVKQHPIQKHQYHNHLRCLFWERIKRFTASLFIFGQSHW